MIEAVVFDLDGVLIDSESACFRLAADLVDVAGGRLERAEYQRFVGVAPTEFWSWLRETYSLPDPLEDLLAYKESRLLDWYRAPAWMPEAPEQIRSLMEAGVPVAVASSSPRMFIESALVASGLADRIGAVVSVDDPKVEHPKPAPDVYLEACALLGSKPTASAAVEDSPTGAMAAIQAGMRVFVVATEWTDGAEFPASVERIEDLGHLGPRLGLS